MSSTAITLIAFACVFASAMLGMTLRRVLPEHHLSAESKDSVKLAAGLVATMSALVLSLLISSAKGTFDRINNELVDYAAKVVTLDHVLAEYGNETRELRDSIKRQYKIKVDLLTSGDPAQLAKLFTPEEMGQIERMHAAIWQLAPRDDLQRALKARAIQTVTELASMRSQTLLQKDASIPMPMLAILIAWLIIIFAAFGICAPHNRTVFAALLIGSLAAAAAILLILELERPLDGLIRITHAPLRDALDQLGR